MQGTYTVLHGARIFASYRTKSVMLTIKKRKIARFQTNQKRQDFKVQKRKRAHCLERGRFYPLDFAIKGSVFSVGGMK